MKLPGIRQISQVASDTSAGVKRKTAGITNSDPTSHINSDSDTDSEITASVLPVVPTKKYRLENGKKLTSTTKGNLNDHVQGHSPTATGASSSHPAKKVNIPLVLENSHGRTSSQSAQSTYTLRPAVVDLEAIKNPKRATTQLKVMPKARVSFASARTTIPNLKPFVLLDPASIRWGFQEGGASSKKEDLKKGMYYIMLSYGSEISLVI